MRPSLYLHGGPGGRLALTAIIIMALLGAWSGILPYAGPAFGYPLPAGSQTAAWQWTAMHWQLYLVAGLATLAGAALLLAGGRNRAVRAAGCALGAIGGAWFVLGPVFAPAFASGFAFASGASTFMTVVTRSATTTAPGS